MNWKIPGSNPTRCSARFKDPTSLQDSWWLLGKKVNTLGMYNHTINQENKTKKEMAVGQNVKKRG